MTALLKPNETLTLGVNVIVRPGDITGSTWIDDECIHETIVAPQDWVALTGPCPTCKGDGHIHYRVADVTQRCLDCRGGRRIVPLYTECPTCHREPWQALVELDEGDFIETVCPDCDDQHRVLVGRGSIEVVPVVGGSEGGEDGSNFIWRLYDEAWLYFGYEEATRLTLDPLPVPGKDFGIVIDVTELI